MTFSTISRRFLALSLALLVTCSVATPAFADSVPVTVSIQEGQLSMSTQTANVALASSTGGTSLAYSDKPQTATGTINFTVDDGRSGAQGWNVTAQVTQLTGPTGTSIAGTNVNATGSNIATVAGSDQKPQGMSATSIDQPKKVVSAGTGAGAGRYTASLNLNVTIPAYSRPGAYAGTVVISVVAGP